MVASLMMRLLKGTGNKTIKVAVSSIPMQSPQRSFYSKTLASYSELKHEFTNRDYGGIPIGVQVRCAGRSVRFMAELSRRVCRKMQLVYPLGWDKVFSDSIVEVKYLAIDPNNWYKIH